MVGEDGGVHARRLDHHQLRRGVQAERRLPPDPGDDPPADRRQRRGETVGCGLCRNQDRVDPGVVPRIGKVAVEWGHGYLR